MYIEYSQICSLHLTHLLLRSSEYQNKVLNVEDSEAHGGNPPQVGLEPSTFLP